MNQTQFSILITLIITFSIIPWIVFSFLFKKSKIRFRKNSSVKQDQKINIIQELNKALTTLKKVGVGATFIIDNYNDVNPYINNSQLLDAKISSNLLINIFEGHNTPLHDGAVVIRNGRLKYASAYITKLSNQKIFNRKMGTRHRSALGLSEHTGAIIVVLSEETHLVTIFKKGTSTIVNLKHFNESLTNIWIE